MLRPRCKNSEWLRKSCWMGATGQLSRNDPIQQLRLVNGEWFSYIFIDPESPFLGDVVDITRKSLSGWWFGTFFIFHNIWVVILPNWRTHIFQRGRCTTMKSSKTSPLSTLIKGHLQGSSISCRKKILSQVVQAVLWYAVTGLLNLPSEYVGISSFGVLYHTKSKNMESFLIESYAEGWSLAFYEPLGVMFHSPNCQSWVWKWIVTPHFGFDDLMGENQRIPEACPSVGGQQSRKRCWIGPSLKPDRHGWCRYPPAIKDNNIYIYI